VFINTFGFSQVDGQNESINLPAKAEKEVVKEPTDTLTVNTKNILPKPQVDIDSVKNDSIKPKPALLQDIVSAQAKDYMTFDRKAQKMYLYTKSPNME